MLDGQFEQVREQDLVRVDSAAFGFWYKHRQNLEFRLEQLVTTRKEHYRLGSSNLYTVCGCIHQLLLVT